MNVYLDASVLVAFFVADHFSLRAETFLAAQTSICVSDFGGIELASALARHVRIGRLTTFQAQAALAAFDSWSARLADEVETVPADMMAAASIIRRLDLNIRTADALNIAIALRLDATLATFDEKMAENARALGAAVAAA